MALLIQGLILLSFDLLSEMRPKCFFLGNSKTADHVGLVLVFLVFGVFTVWYDFYTDILVALDFISRGDVYWGGCTLVVVLGPFFATLLDVIMWKAKYGFRKRFLPKESRRWCEVFWSFPPFHLIK